MNERPDFSGEWTLNRQASTLSPGADGVQSAVWQIEHRDPSFRHQAAFETTGDPIQWEYDLLADGQEVVFSDEGVTTASSLTWAGSALVVVWRIQRPDGEMTISFRYELVDDERRRLEATEQVRGTDHDQDNVWVFERR